MLHLNGQGLKLSMEKAHVVELKPQVFWLEPRWGGASVDHRCLILTKSVLWEKALAFVLSVCSIVGLWWTPGLVLKHGKGLYPAWWCEQ